MKSYRVVTAAAVVAVALTGCSQTRRARASAREDTARRVKTEAVRQESVRRAIEVVGTLAAEDQVTISSQADGAVSRVLVDHYSQRLLEKAQATPSLIDTKTDYSNASPEVSGRRGPGACG